LQRLRIATRASRLALAQSHLVAAALRAHHPDLEVEFLEVSTKGDRDGRPFADIGGKGLFTSEVERAVATGEADVAIHSAKDLTSDLAEGCVLVCIPERASSHDVVVGGKGDSGEERLGSLPPGSVIGTSSLRRRALLLAARPDLEVAQFRGNLDTRLAKVAAGEVDAAILAAAGIERLYRDGEQDEALRGALDKDGWVPAPAQGALAIEGRARRADLIELFAPLDHAPTRAEVECERAFGLALEGGCSVPLGCSARATGDRLLVLGFLGMPDGSQSLRDRISGGLSEAAALGRELAGAIRDAGGADILEELRHTDPPALGAP
jgi:hydroxymethylbilane synthase